MRDAVCYRRASSEEQAESGLGLEAQRDRIAAFCAMKGFNLIADYEDAGVSAGNPLEDRPAGGRLIADVRTSKAVVVAAKLDRLFRSVGDACLTIDSWDKQGVALISIAEGFDTTDENPFGRAMLQIVAVFAELERRLIKQRTKDALAVKRRKGERISRHIPYGKDLAADGIRLTDNPEEQAVLEIIKVESAKGLGARKIATTLNELGIKPKRGGEWRHSSILGMLKRTEANGTH